MNTRFKVIASYNILPYDFIHVLIFVIVSKCRKSPKLTYIVNFVNTTCYIVFYIVIVVVMNDRSWILLPPTMFPSSLSTYS